MKVIIYIILIAVSIYFAIGYFVLDVRKRDRSHYLTTFVIRDGIYVEKYELYNRLNSPTGLYSEYITDSLNFRKYIGVFSQQRLPQGTLRKIIKLEK